MRSFSGGVLHVSILDNECPKQLGRPESHKGANPPLAVMNATSSRMYRNMVPPTLLPLIPSLQIIPPHPAKHLRPTKIPHINRRKATTTTCFRKTVGQNGSAGQEILGVKFPADSGNLQHPGCKKTNN